MGNIAKKVEKAMSAGMRVLNRAKIINHRAETLERKAREMEEHAFDEYFNITARMDDEVRAQCMTRIVMSMLKGKKSIRVPYEKVIKLGLYLYPVRRELYRNAIEAWVDWHGQESARVCFTNSPEWKAWKRRNDARKAA